MYICLQHYPSPVILKPSYSAFFEARSTLSGPKASMEVSSTSSHFFSRPPFVLKLSRRPAAVSIYRLPLSLIAAGFRAIVGLFWKTQDTLLNPLKILISHCKVKAQSVKGLRLLFADVSTNERVRVGLIRQQFDHQLVFTVAWQVV